FGPVPSRRLGLSLGVDIVPFKVCTLDCVYCQIGGTTEKSIERKPFVPIEDVISQLREKLASGIEADYITISGSGEPTLNSQMGYLIEQIKRFSKIPVTVITNGTLLFQTETRADCSKADLVVPSLDAVDEKSFEKINRPASGLTFEKLVDGLVAFRSEYNGPIWLEVFLVEGINTDDDSVDKFRHFIELTKPDKVQLNTAVRPTADMDIERISIEKMERIAARLGGNVEVIADFSGGAKTKHIQAAAESLLSMLKRRPCSIDDICSGMGLHPNEAVKHIKSLQADGLVTSEKKGDVVYFLAK
ncbi:MAG: radical SAM protein, partial [Phycisphaerae bacterium]|nr:radical SAM protein [Phycisphaerae bacterium]